ncbi:MAG: prepilin-type N-terminal cleavage/methylation domain-containing protein [Chloroflexi bacterium]|nr:prepilin-type N-terminal cleavage/methylation domain-containing protein [Chloroflexota bacterium]
MRDEKGFGLIEVLVATAIMAVLGLAFSMTTSQVMDGTRRSNNRISAISQVQNAAGWISRDARMATGLLTDNLTTPDFLVMSWKDESSDDQYQVIYTLEDVPGSSLKKMQRQLWVNGAPANTTLIARYIDPAPSATKCDFTGGVLSVTLTAVAGDRDKVRSETRVFQVTPRPN